MYDVQTGEKHPQVENRGTRTFRDQHGRQWKSVIENKTGHPVHPPSPAFSAPVIPTEKYVLVKAGDGGELEIDYLAWQRDLLQLNADFEQRKFDIAHAEYKDNPGEALENPTPFLLKAIGEAPLHPDVPRACMAGNRWILGFSDVKPSWAIKYFPEKKEERSEFPDAEFPDEEPSVDSNAGEFPRHVGGHVYLLSDGNKVRGKEAALDAEKAIAEFAGAGT